MAYSIHSLNQRSKKKFCATDWAYKEGVFQTPQGFYIARIKINNKSFETISKHKTREEAESAYFARKKK